MRKLAVRKEAGVIPGSGFHYMLHPMIMANDQEAEIFSWMGHIILEVSDEDAAIFCSEARAALSHQVGIAYLTEAAIRQQELKRML